MASSITPTSDGATEIDFDIMRGRPAALKARVEAWEVPGLDGYGVQILAKGDAQFDLVTVAYFEDDDIDGASEAADSHIESCEAAQGQLVNITDDWGTEFDDVMVVHVETSQAKRPCIKDGQACVRVELHWKMLSTSSSDD